MSEKSIDFDKIMLQIELLKSKCLRNEEIEEDYRNILNSFYFLDEDQREILYSGLEKIILINHNSFEKFNLGVLDKISQSILKNQKNKALKQIWYFIHKKSVYNIKIFDSEIKDNILKLKCVWLASLFESYDINKIINTEFYLFNKDKKQKLKLRVEWGKESYYKYDYPHEKLINENDNFYLLINLNDLEEGEYKICYEFLGEKGRVIISNAAVSRKLKTILKKEVYHLRFIRFRVSYREVYINIKVKERNKRNLIKLNLDILKYDLRLISRLKRDKLKLKFIYLFYNTIKAMYKQKIVLLGELPNTYEDSSSVLFDYLRKTEQSFKYYYVTTKRDLLKEDSRFIKFGGFKHKLLFILADVIANVQNIDLYMNPFMKRDKNFLAKKEAEDTLLYLAFSKYFSNQKRIFLQHGVLYQSGLTNAIYVNSDFDYLVVSTEFEKKVFPSRGRYFLESCLPRFSKYNENSLSERKILFSPTWRKYLKNINDGKLDMNIIKESEYYQKIIEVITSSEINSILEVNNYTMIYNVHHTLRGMIEEDLKYIKLPSNIYIKKETDNLNDLINECSICITDYSSLFFDFLWQGKKVINYIFDYYDFHTRKDNNKKMNEYFDMKNFVGNICVENYYDLVRVIESTLTYKENDYKNFKNEIFFNVTDPCEYVKREIENVLKGE
ncbi:CDP-glycerol glycerophosphotransferase family protein [Clostridium tertium]|uniref:CDP-glycerol glycerophosphotransferase family protein n=1 Tax=Clostridium tertium TaxID=1559 RepID=UPI0034A33209